MGFKYKLTRAAGVFGAFNVANGRYSGRAIIYPLGLIETTALLVEWYNCQLQE